LIIAPTVDHLLEVHRRVRKAHPESVSAGWIDRGKIEAIVKKPFMEVYGHRRYDTIYKQAACLMEGIIRLHPFSDGNKRTALLMTYTFLRSNGIYMAVPLDVVRFMVGVARNESNTEDEIDDLIDRISIWLERRSTADSKQVNAKTWEYVEKPLWKMALLLFTGIGIIYVRRKFREWFVMDTHPDYAKSAQETMQFILGMTFGSVRALQSRGARQ
jgi:death-on-curing protein